MFAGQEAVWLTPSFPDVVTISKEVAHEPRTEIPGKVDGIACFPSEACSNGEDDKEEAEGSEVASPDVSVVLEGIDEEHKES